MKFKKKNLTPELASYEGDYYFIVGRLHSNKFRLEDVRYRTKVLNLDKRQFTKLTGNFKAKKLKELAYLRELFPGQYK